MIVIHTLNLDINTSSLTILSAVVQGILEPGRIDEPYALDDLGGSGQSLSSFYPIGRLMRNNHSRRRVTAASKT